MNIRNLVFGAFALGAFFTQPATAQSQCDPVMYNSADPNCWGQYEGHANFTTEFTIQVMRVWTETPIPNYPMAFADVVRTDTGEQLLLKCGTDGGGAKEACYHLETNSTYRVRGGSGYGYVYVYQPNGGQMTWMETFCDPSSDKSKVFCVQ